MSQDHIVKLKCKETGDIKYSVKNKKKNPEKLQLKKYNPKLRKHTTYEETKK